MEIRPGSASARVSARPRGGSGGAIVERRASASLTETTVWRPALGGVPAPLGKRPRLVRKPAICDSNGSPFAAPLAVPAASVGYLLLLCVVVIPLSFSLITLGPRYLPAHEVALIGLLENVGDLLEAEAQRSRSLDET